MDDIAGEGLVLLARETDNDDKTFFHHDKTF